MPKNDALARRWPNGDGGRWQLYLAEFTQEEIAGDCLKKGTVPGQFRPTPRKLRQSQQGDSPLVETIPIGGMHRSVVSRDLQSARDVCRSGDSPDLGVARFTQMAIRKRGQAPYTLYEVEARYTTSGSQSPFTTEISSRGCGSILARKEDLRPSGRWIRTPTEVVIRYAI
jgi:hypothetical protein